MSANQDTGHHSSHQCYPIRDAHNRGLTVVPTGSDPLTAFLGVWTTSIARQRETKSAVLIRSRITSLGPVAVPLQVHVNVYIVCS